jgi:ABC-type bacteriocin/lantibiotic exporter with double-glycine peptidase domain
MIYISPSLTGVTFGAIIPIILLAVFFGNKMRKIQREIQK